MNASFVYSVHIVVGVSFFCDHTDGWRSGKSFLLSECLVSHSPISQANVIMAG